MIAAAWLLGAAAVGFPPSIGQPVERIVTAEDTIIDMARRYRVGFTEIRQANPGIDPWLPGEGRTVILPAQHLLPRWLEPDPDAGETRILINVAEMRLYVLFADPATPERGRVVSFPISVGRQDWRTPLGTTQITQRIKDPTWTPPQSIREEAQARGETLPDVVPAGPDNPLGQHALRLALPGYLIHGTNRPAGIGMQVTHGCIRMYPADIAWLYDNVTVDTRVDLVNQPFKFRWIGETLWLEAHAAWVPGAPDQQSLEPLDAALAVALEERPGAVVDLDRVREIAASAVGMPEIVPLLAHPEQLAPAPHAPTTHTESADDPA
ncbi:L,D-transpeptidase family protein [Abyssibacter profundi]|uniref:L,D-transpeptidase n=1 Tax=Abyssibacter profundi TaxID=2182787 RepID=A0A363UQ62_9GAMM|nr:L,D-transpeptidase family protein [Abyssibacter profundi]PWN57598.1 L,D-transpeptidase [Abyssibacter profundi]